MLKEPLTLSLSLVAAAIVVGIVIASRGARPGATTKEPARAFIEHGRSVVRFLSPMFVEPKQGHLAPNRGVESPLSDAEPQVDRFAERLAKIIGA